VQRAVVVIIAILESAVKVVAVTDVVVTQITVARIKRSFLLKDIISTNKLFRYFIQSDLLAIVLKISICLKV
tara:strand:- start:146 stop:361 length:216 start_codon:yes stop_codon:yes gene_type:complete